MSLLRLIGQTAKHSSSAPRNKNVVSRLFEEAAGSVLCKYAKYDSFIPGQKPRVTWNSYGVMLARLYNEVCLLVYALGRAASLLPIVSLP